MTEVIKRLRKYIKSSREFYKKFKLEEITSGSEIGLDQDIEKVINRLENLQQENEKLKKYKERCAGALEFINSRQENMIPEHCEDLHYILCESEEGEW